MTDKARLKIEQLDKSGNVTGTPFEASINPATYALSTEFCFTEDNKLLNDLPEKLELPALVLDGTGVVPSDGAPKTVPQQLDALRAVVTATAPDETGYKTRPVVRVSWGTLQFVGRVKKMDVTYTLFAPNGVPLRATVKLGFIGPDTPRAASAGTVPQAATMTRQIQVSASTLAQLCFTEYADPGRDQAVARANALTSIRNLPPGQKLVF